MKSILKKLLVIGTLSASVSASATLPYFPIQFPRDDFAHYENVPYTVNNMTEWWYFNGQIKTQEGRTFGYYVSYNYMLLNWVTGKPVIIPMMNIQVTDVDNKKVYGNSFLGDMQQSHFSTTTMDVNIGANMLTKVGDSYIVDDTVLAKTGEKLHLALKLTPTRNPMLIGGQGYVPEDANSTSYYYSFSNLTTEGNFEINDQKFTVDPTQSLSWYDRQWGDFFVQPTSMWFWTSIQLTNKISINLRWIVDPTTKLPKKDECDATILMPDGSQLFTKDITVENYLPHGNEYPSYYKISIPLLDMHLMLTDQVGNQNSTTLYEGIVQVSGVTQGSHKLEGTGWAESTIKN